MKFQQALELLPQKKRITRDDWPYFLSFDKQGYLILRDHKGEISPYVISEYDFNYEWEIFD